MSQCVYMWCEPLVGFLLWWIILKFVFRAQSLWVQPFRMKTSDESPFADYLGDDYKTNTLTNIAQSPKKWLPLQAQDVPLKFWNWCLRSTFGVRDQVTQKERPIIYRCGIWAQKGHCEVRPIAPDGRGGRREEEVCQSLWGFEIAEMLRQLPRAAGDTLFPADPALVGSGSWLTI